MRFFRRLSPLLFATLLAAGCGKKAPQPETKPPEATTAPATAPDAEPAPAADAAPAAAPDAEPAPAPDSAPAPDAAVAEPEFKVMTEQFADLRILRYRIPDFEKLPLNTKQLVYWLSEAALNGRDIAWDQRHPDGLRIRRTLEAIDKTYKGDKAAPEYAKFMEYLKRVWFSHGIYHHYSNKKMEPGFSAEYFATLVAQSDPAALPLDDKETPEALVKRLSPILFDPTVDPVAVSLDSDKDLLEHSANNFYAHDITQKEAETYYAKLKDPKDTTPVMWGLNSKLVKEGNTLVEKPWKVGGMYGAAIERIVACLEKAATFAENDTQKAWILALVEFYKSGELEKFDDFNVAWVKDTGSVVDAINGFIETYGDALDMRGTFEGVVQIKDDESSKRIAAISSEAQWFEDHSSIDAKHKKPDVKGISARVVNVAVGTGDSGPAFPIGINLPNSDWIRREHGSKSVNLGNIVHAYEEDRKASGVLEEFAVNDEVLARLKQHADLASRLEVDMHEVIGHASGKLEEGVAPMSDTLKNYAGTLEEARADLVALYFITDPKLVEMGLMPSLDVGKAAYDEYVMNALLVQFSRLKAGENLEEAHMRNRHLIAKWIMTKGGADVVAQVEKSPGKTAFLVKDHEKFRALVGELLKEIQRIKSTGDYEAGKALVEDFGVEVDQKVADEVRERYGKLGIAPYRGFINPRLTLLQKPDSDVVSDVVVDYPEDFADQMRAYAANYSVLPTNN